MDEIQLAYLAGAFDSHGCVSLSYSRKGKYKYLQKTLVFSHSDRSLCELFQRTFGSGNISTTDSRLSARNPTHQWRLNGKATVGVADALLPYIRHMRAQFIEKILADTF